MAETFNPSPEAGSQYEPLGPAELVDHDESSVRFTVGPSTVEVAAMAPDLFRVGMFAEGKPPNYESPAIDEAEWEPQEVSLQETDRGVEIKTSQATASVSLSPFRISFKDSSGHTFASDDPDLGMGSMDLAEDDPAARFGKPVRLYKKREKGDRYFACGQRTGGLEKTGSRQNFWNTDPPMGHTDDQNNMYTSTPFTLVMNHGFAWGLFLDNTHQVGFDLAKEAEDRARFEARGGDLIYYVFCGPEPRDVVGRYTQLTGRIPMPPKWSLGHHQCRYSYMSEEEVREIADTFREKDIPCDVIHFDIDYMDGYRVFTWDDENFPDPEKLISDLAEQGFHSVSIIDPGVKVDENYEIYIKGSKKDLFCKTDKGDDYHNAVWPGVCSFPDFTNPEARRWWGDNHRGLLNAGISGIWCDMNEPALFIPKNSTMPENVVHPGGGGEARYHAEIHNTYGSLMAQATREGLLRHRPESRPFVISRSGYSGLQRHALQWTGDNSSWWEHIWMSMPQLMNMGLSGVAWTGIDIGGHFGDADGELLARFVEFGVFQPFCRNHSAKGTARQEPWAFGEPCESVYRKMVKLRMRLLPYLYTLFEESHRTGAPIMRPMLFEYPGDTTTYTVDDEFLVGDAMLVAPITRRGIEHRHVYLPEGCWFHYWTGERFDGPAHVLAHAPLGEPPIYVKANCAIPLGPEMNHTGEKTTDPLTLLLYPAPGAGESTLYEDAGDGFAYQNGEYTRRSISCQTYEEKVSVHLGDREGSLNPEREEVLIELRGLRTPEEVWVDGEATSEWRHDEDTRTLTVSLTEKEPSSTVEVHL